MHVTVLGAGVVGVTTAFYLAKKGCRVTVVDRDSAVANAASHANGGQLSYSFTDALARPGMPATLPRLLAGSDPAIRIRPPLEFEFLRWSLQFLRQCTPRHFRDNTSSVLQCALRSASLLRELEREFEIDFSHRAAGKLVLLRTAAAMAAAAKSASLKNSHGCSVSVLSMDDAYAIEPAIRAMRSGYLGAVYSRDDEVGDARRFTEGLAACLRRHYGVEFRLRSAATGLRRARGRVVAVEFPDGMLETDAVVVCLGAWSAGFLRRLSLSLPVIPVRGYSITLPRGRQAPDVSISDIEHRIVFSSMNGKLRIAGFADFAGFDRRADADRVATLLRVARDVAPEAADFSAESVEPWGGFRAMTANSRPIVGSTTVPGLYVNCGHGMLGWTLACATGFDVAQHIGRPG